MVFLNQNSVRLCRAGSCCPVLEKVEDGFTITDDFGGKVQLSEDEIVMLIEAFNAIK